MSTSSISNKNNGETSLQDSGDAMRKIEMGVDCRLSMFDSQCKFCSENITKSNSCDDLGATVCQKCGTLQSKEEQSFENSMVTSSTGFGFVRPQDNETATFRRFLAITFTIASSLNLPSHLNEKITDMAGNIYKDEQLKMRKCGPKVAACIYYVTRSCDFFIPLRKLSSATQTPMSYINKCIKFCIKRLKLEPLPYMNCASFLDQYTAYCKNERPQLLMDWSMEIESIVNTTAKGTSPAVAAAALLKVVLEGKKVPFKFRCFCKDVSLNYHHVSNMATKIRRSLLSYSQRIPWKPTTLNEKNVGSFLPEIFKYHEEFSQRNDSLESSTATATFREKVELVLKAKSACEEFDSMKYSDPVFEVIWELLDKGCSGDELLSQNLATLSQKYLDCVDDGDFYDCEIDDQEIEELLK